MFLATGFVIEQMRRNDAFIVPLGVTLNVSKELLQDAPGFDKDCWPNMSDKTWADGIHTYYGTKPYPVHMNA